MDQNKASHNKSLNHYLIAFFIAWSATSSVIILVLIKLGISGSIIFALKDSPIYIAMIIFFHAWGLQKKSIHILTGILIFIAALILNLTILTPDYANPAANIRQIVAPILISAFFLALKLNIKDVTSGAKILYLTLLAVFIFGTIEIAFEIWKSIDLSKYFNLKGIPVDEHGLSYMFYEPILGYRERMTSTFLDPISLGHFFASTFIVAFYKCLYEGKQRFIVMSISIAGLVLCFSKGAFLQAFIGTTILNPRIHLFIRALLLSIPFAIFSAIPNKAGILIHLNGLSSSFTNLTVFGHGIGSSGNYSKMFSENLNLYSALGISDTYIGAVLGQIGILGFACWAALVVCSLTPFKKKALNTHCIIMASIVLVSFISENTMNVTSFTLPAIIIALVRSYEQNLKTQQLQNHQHTWNKRDPSATWRF